MSEPIDAEVVEEPGTEVALAEPQPASLNLFHTDDPVEVINQATRVADALSDVVRKKGLVKQIKGRDHPLVEAWTTLGAMLGLSSVPVWTKRVDAEYGTGWEARVEIRATDGRVVGAADAMCLRSETMWKSRDEYALRSMAQTRATSKAFRGPLGFVMSLAGYEATPEAEMPPQEPAAQESPEDKERRGRALALQERMGGLKLKRSEIQSLLAKAGVAVQGDNPREWLLSLTEEQSGRMDVLLNEWARQTGV